MTFSILLREAIFIILQTITLSDNTDCIEELIIKLEGLSDNAIDWMDNNYMIANP